MLSLKYRTFFSVGQNFESIASLLRELPYPMLLKFRQEMIDDAIVVRLMMQYGIVYRTHNYFKQGSIGSQCGGITSNESTTRSVAASNLSAEPS